MLAGLGVGWSDVTAVDIYRPHPIHGFLAARRARPHGAGRCARDTTGTSAIRPSRASSTRWTCGVVRDEIRIDR